MNIPSTTLHIEVARVGSQYLARCQYDYGAGSTGGMVEVIQRSQEELQSWLANLTIKVN